VAAATEQQDAVA